MRRPRSFVLPALVLCLGAGAAPAGSTAEPAAETPRIYKWVDANGIAHYTTDPERIPKALRNRIEPLARPAPEPAAAPQPAEAPQPAAAVPEPALAATTGPAPPAEPETPAPAESVPAAPVAPIAAPVAPIAAPVPPIAAPVAPSAASVPAPVPPSAASIPVPAVPPAGEAWATRDAAPRLPSSALIASGKASPAQLAALHAERQALDARIAEVEAEIARDENALKDLISDPDLDAEVPLFDRPEFLEISRRLPGLQTRLQELRDERAKLETP